MITIYIGKPNKLPETEPLDAEALGVTRVAEILQSLDLFGEQKTYRIYGLDNDDLKQDFIKVLPDIEHAPSDVIVVVEKLLAADRKKAEKHATIHETKARAEPKEAFNAFALANAFAMGDRKKSWIVFQELLVHDDEMEKIHGMIWWKLKDMMGKRSPFSKDQLNDMARTLVSVYHESRLGGMEMRDGLEEFFLTLPIVKK